MPSRSQSRFRSLAPSLFFGALLFVSACATQPAGPVGPISTGQPRAEPQTSAENDIPLNPDIELDGQRVDRTELPPEDTTFTPPHLAGQDIIRAGVVLPFSDRRSAVRDEAEGMLAAIELALFDGFGENFVIIPKDTAGSQETAQLVGEELARAGADLVLGPLFGANVSALRDVPALAEIPLITFSNDVTVAGNGTWLASIAPEEEVREIVEYAYQQGYDAFAFFGPRSSLGQRIETAMRREVFLTGGDMIASRFYDPSAGNPNLEAESFSQLIQAEAELGRRIAVLVPERGNRLRQVAPLLAYYGVDTRIVKMLGLSNWNDSDIWREPSLRGAWFPSPPVEEIRAFEERYERLYGRAPSSLAAIAYDAAALSMALASDGELTAEELTQPDGFAGVNGLFRFRANGTAERALSILEVYPDPDARGVRVIRSAPDTFVPVTN